MRRIRVALAGAAQYLGSMTLQKTLTPRATFYLILLSLIWGGSFLSIRITLDEVPVMTSVAWRVAPAAILLWVWIAFRQQSIPRGWRLWGALFVMGMLNNVLPFSLMAWAQLHIESGLTSILNATTAIFGVVIAAVALQDERLSFRKVVGVSLGFAGVLAAIGPSALEGFDFRSLAQFAVLGGTFCYACAGLWARINLSDLPAEVAAAGMLTGSSVILVPAALWLEGLPSLDLAAATWGAIGYSSVISTGLAYLLYYRILAAAGSANLLFVTLMIPPIAIALGAAVRGEALGNAAVLGLALLATGLAVLDGRALKAIRRVSET